jgi:hypothetical protein
MLHFVELLEKTMRLFFIVCLLGSAQIWAQQYPYEVSEKLPFGAQNPKVPEQLKDFGQLAGQYSCQSTARNAQQEWKEPEEIIWRWKFIMNGMGVQDETLKPDGSHSGSIRVYDADSLTWRVHYYSNTAFPKTLGSWNGNGDEDGDIILYRDQAAPNGTPGFYRITFSDIGHDGFEWLGEWVNKPETFSFPTWKISCVRQQ